VCWPRVCTLTFFWSNAVHPKATPVHDPVATLVYSAGQPNIETVVVNGRILLANGAFVQLNEAELLHAAQHAAQNLAHRGTERLLDRRGRWRPVWCQGVVWKEMDCIGSGPRERSSLLRLRSLAVDCILRL
jgi:hypothetical protein